MGGHGAQGGIMNGGNPLGDTTALFFLQLAIIIATTRVLAVGLSWMNQPRVIAEVLSGILLGPSVLGYIPGWIPALFPSSSQPPLVLLANCGLVLYMFLVGMELNPATLFMNARYTVAISVAGILVPFVMGAAGSLKLYEHMESASSQGKRVPFPSFLLFTGLAMSITAFPVLARILTDLKLVHTDVGIMTIGAAAIDDCVAWCLLILVIAILNSTNLLTALYVFMLVLAYGLFLFIVVKPPLRLFFARFSAFESGTTQKSILAIIFIAIFLSAFFTQIAGVHAIFGGFMLGLIVPRDNAFALQLASVIENFVSIVLLPLYFAASGLRTRISSLNSVWSLVMLIMVLTIATTGKLLGCALTARLLSIPWREAATLGVLMNTRGLVELIVLNLGLDAGVIDEEIFTIMVIMALVTTFATSPVVSYIYPPKYYRKLVMIEGTDDFTGAQMEAAEAAEERGEFRLLAVAQYIDEVPGNALVMAMLRPDSLSVVRFVESLDPSLAVILGQSSRMAIKLDPTLQMFNTCAYLAGVPSECELKVCKPEEYAEELCQKAKTEDVAMVLVPMRKRSMRFGDSHNRFITETISRCDRTLLLFWDHQLNPRLLSPGGESKHILALYQGGVNDEEVLALAYRFMTQGKNRNIKVEVLMVSRGGGEKEKVEKDFKGLQSRGFVGGEVDVHQMCIGGNGGGGGGAAREKYEEVVEECKKSGADLLIVGCSEGHKTMGSEMRTAKRSSVFQAAERILSKTILMEKISTAVTSGELECSLIVVMKKGVETAGLYGAGNSLEPLGVEIDEERKSI